MKSRSWTLLAGLPLVAGCPVSYPEDPTGACLATGFTPHCSLHGGGGVVATARWDGGFADDAGSLNNGFLDSATCASLCSCVSTNNCFVPDDGGYVECSMLCIGGRAPPGLGELSKVDATAGSWLARMAELEAAAVYAFLHLARELDAHRLPAFAAAARRAAGEEVLHAQKVARLAVRRGFAPQPLKIKPSGIRTLAAIATENAAEGCGRELFGAVLNRHQARTAADPDVARVMGEIAEEESAHATFSFDLAEHLTPRLTVAQRNHAREAQAAMLTTLQGDDVSLEAARALGLMTSRDVRATTRRLLDERAL